MSCPMMPPNMELSQRLLNRVPYSHRLPAGRLLPPVGIIPGDVRSLSELHLLLAPDDRSLPGVNFNALVEWVERVIGDRELADALRKTAENKASYVDGCLKVCELVGQRLTQAIEVAGREVLR